MYGFIRNCIRMVFTRTRMLRPRGKVAPALRRRPCLELLEDRLVPSAYVQTNLVSDIMGQAQVFDPSLKNPWGVSESSTSPFWVSDQGSSNATLYMVTPSGASKVSLTVSIPTTGSGPQGPTGQVFNNTSTFDVANGLPATFIFANLNGTISGWYAGTSATIEATKPGAVYTGLAIGSNAQGNFLYAANDAAGTINVFNGSFQPVSLGQGGFGTFTDPNLPSGLVPFNVENLNGQLYVTYAPIGHLAQTSATPGEGAVAVFDTSGNFIRQLAAGGPLASPWGMALAPSSFGQFGGDLLVGNFAYKDSVIDAFDPTTGKFLGTLTGANGQPILNPGLWTLTFGNGTNGGDPNTLYFSAGINAEKDGLFGAIQVVPTLPTSIPLTAPTTPLAQLASSIFLSVDQGLESFFQTLDAELSSLESMFGTSNPNLSNSFAMLEANLNAFGASVFNSLEMVEDGVVGILNQL